jgi:hypothetical protein
MGKNLYGVDDYTLRGYIRIESGSVTVDYRCVRPDTVRTEILAGKGKGTVVLYVPDQRKDQVKAKSGAFRVWRNIKKLKIENTPLVESLLDMLLRMMSDMKGAAFKGDVHMEARLGEKVEVALTPDPSMAMTPAATPVSPSSPSSSTTPAPSPAEAANDPYADVLGLKSKPGGSPEPAVSPKPGESPEPAGSPEPAVSPKPGGSPEPAGSPGTGEPPKSGSQDTGNGLFENKQISKDCYLVEVKGEEFYDLVAVDKEGFWPVYAKRVAKDGKLVFEAVITGITTNTSPKMEL